MTSGDYGAIADALEATVDPRVLEAQRPRFNAAPGDELGVLMLVDGARRIVPARWGFRVRDSALINARAESLTERPTFSAAALGAGRCVVISDGFFEWSGPKGQRQPHWFHRPDPTRPHGAGLLPFAGVARREGDELHFVVVTLESDALVARYHHRMPAMLDLQAVGAWLEGAPVGGDIQAGPGLDTWLRGIGPRDLTARTVSRRVNATGDDDAALLDEVEPPPPAPVQTSLFD